MTTDTKKALAEADRKARTLVSKLKPGQTPAETIAGLVVAGLAGNSVAAREWSMPSFADNVDVTACLGGIADAAERVKRGDLGHLEAVLTAHVITLNVLFTDLALRARRSTTLDPLERYLRLAMKAQSMCRATVEALATLKNPPMVFARQANIAQGPQQVNNALAQPSPPTSLARAENCESEQNKLLGAARYAERVDGGTTDAASARHPALASLGTVDGPADA